MLAIAKIFTNGRSQAVRLPAPFRFDGKEVYIRKNPETGDVILSNKPADWEGFFAALNAATVPADFLSPEQRQQDVGQRDVFADWSE